MNNKDKIISILTSLVGAVFTVYGLLLCALSNLNLGVTLVLALGVFVLFTGIFYSRMKKFTAKGILRVAKLVIAGMLCAEFAIVSFLGVYGISDNVDYSEDAVIVLGAGIRGDRVTLPLKLRLDKAIEYHRKNPEAVIVVTGGQGFQETVTEAYAMEKYLLEKGVDKSKILKEENATSTAENMEFSKEILDGYFDGEYSVVVVTNNFHIFRGVAIAKKTGFEAVAHFHAGLQWYNLMPCFLRESLAVMKMVVFD